MIKPPLRHLDRVWHNPTQAVNTSGQGVHSLGAPDTLTITMRRRGMFRFVQRDQAGRHGSRWSAKALHF